MVSGTRLALALALAALSCGVGAARSSPWPPSTEHPQIQLWRGAPPDTFHVNGPEHIADHPKTVDALRYIEVSNVSRPTLTLYQPQKRSTNAAVLVFPGGGYWTLAIDLEGTEVCDWLTTNGITCILVKYRVPSYDKEGKSRSGPYPNSPVALEDAQRAIALTRFNARKWGIDPSKVGVLGFSAGGHLVAATSTHDRVYTRTDAIDDISVRPDFGIALYPGHLWVNEDAFALNSAVPVNSKTPPQFIVQSEDDPVDEVNNSLVYYIALKRAKVPSELHIYPEGGHAFGLRHTDKAITDWPQLALRWLKTIGVITTPMAKQQD